VPTTASQSEKTFIKTTQPGRMQIDMRILVTTGAVIAILATLGLLAYVMCGRQTNRDINNVDESITLERLENDHQDLFDWMCLKLDNGRWWYRRDYERLAAKYKNISLEERNALHDQLQWKGSPSKMLMSLLQTKYPNLRLRDFVGTLKEIGRNDIAQRLMLYTG